MRLFELTKRFPPEERYTPTSQVRRSSRAVCLNLREAWAKRMYPPHFFSKLIDFARDCAFISAEEYASLVSLSDEVRRMLGAMLKNPRPFLIALPEWS
jgi:hypothetical protein